MTVWIMQTGEPLPIDQGDPRPMRAMNLTNALIASGHKVVLWSSAFYHQEKRHRNTKFESIKVSENLEVRLIPSPGYKRNIGPGRLWDHAIMALNLSRELKMVTDKPDIAFIGYPPIEPAAIMAKWLKRNGIKYMLDVKDQWPHIFVEALPKVFRPFGKVAFSPYFYLGRQSIRNADGLSAMSKSFLEWSVAFAGRPMTKNDKVVPLTTPADTLPVEEIESANIWWDEQGIVNDGTPTVSFVGSHSRAFDMLHVIEAAKKMSEEGMLCQFVICGDGPSSTGWKEMAFGLNNVFFPGWVDIAKGEALGRRSTAALAPYTNVENFTLNIPNKIIDSLAQGLPILSPLRGEVEELISKYKVGMVYSEANSLESRIKELTNNQLRQEISQNCKELYKSEFSYTKVYGELVSHLEMLSSEE